MARRRRCRSITGYPVSLERMSASASTPGTTVIQVASLFGRSALAERAQQIKTEDILEHVALVQTWLDDYETGSLKKDKETAREQQYNADFFGTILGYRSKPANPYTFEPKDTTEKKQYPDAVLRYTDLTDSSINNIAAVVELKGASINLDKPQQREGNMSPVQQAFKYKPQYRSCPFVVVSNFYEFRLYNDTQLDYESWTLQQLVDPADDYLNFKKWYALLHVENMTAPSGKSVTERLLSDIRQKQLDVGKDFYAKYSSVRTALLQDVWRKNPNTRFQFALAIQKVQTIIDRVMFACFAEDGGLLPDDTLQRVIKDAENSSLGTLWDELKDFFTLVDRGSGKLGIPHGYNGGLFAHDPLLDALDISDGPLRRLLDLGKYDFKEDLRVNILGHVFEQSITDIEQIKRRVQNDQKPFDPQQDLDELSRRKKEGIYYTPDYIVRYIVANALGGYLSEQELRIQKKHNLSGMRTEAGYEAREKVAYTEYQHVLQTIKVLDPACGSGAFLVHVFDYLLAENLRVDAILGGSLTSQEDFVRNILSGNIFGVDLNEESVEITKLSLWLKTASKGKKLTALDENIKCGNSLLSDPAVTDDSFDWHEEFGDVMDKGGFDVVVGNPPYVNAIEMKKSLPEDQRKRMKKDYETAKGAVDLYVYFFERGINLLHDGGRLGYITPNRYVSVSYGSALRQWLVDNYTFESILNCSDSRVFEDAATYPIITILEKSAPAEHYQVKAGKLEEQQPTGVWVTHDSEKLSSLPEYIIGFLLNDKLPVTEKIFSQGELLTEVGAINATSTAGEADEYAQYISETTGQRIVNTGTIDPYQPLWGKELFTKQGRRFLRPLLDLDAVGANRRTLYETDKIILSKLGLRAEAFYDRNGEYASIDTNCIHTFSEDYAPEYVLCWLNSRLYNFVFECLFDGARMSGGYMGYSAPNLRCTPIKKLSDDEQQQFVDIARELGDLYQQKGDADRKFRSIVTMAVELKSWPGVNAEWWELDDKTFIANFKKRFKTAELEDLMDAHEKHAANMKKIVDRIGMLSHRADRRFYNLFGLTRTEIAKVESMEFVV